MSVSFYPYVLRNTDEGPLWDFPAAAKGRMQSENVPEYDTPEYWAWYDGDPEVEAACRNPDYDSRLDINLCERNGRFVLNELGLLPGTGDLDIYNSDPLPIDAFEIGLRATIARNPEPIPGLPGFESNEPDRAREISAGVADGYANRVFERLLSLVEAAREYGATHIGWG
jgi:hypothetical protein